MNMRQHNETTWKDIRRQYNSRQRRRRVLATMAEAAVWLACGAFGVWFGYWLGRAF